MPTGGCKFILDRMAIQKQKCALIYQNEKTTYGQLLAMIDEATAVMTDAGINSGQVVQLRGDFTPSSIAYLLALINMRAIVSPVAPTSMASASEYAQTARAAWIVDAETTSVSPADGASDHSMYDELRQLGDAGVIIFTSGTTGVAKAALHNATYLLGKFHVTGKDYKTLAFLLFDHIAGFDTLMYSLSNASTLVCPHDRSADAVCELIARYDVEVLPTAPSFLNMIYLSEAHKRHDLNSLEIITYGAEMMPQSLLERSAQVLPHARLIQKYGTSEIGALRSQSEHNTSRWIRIGDHETDWRIKDGLLEVKTNTAMVGYLNADSPFTEDGYYKTGDHVEQRGDMIRFAGRDSDIINVGGEKVFPAEVEAAIKPIDGILDVAVYGAQHPILGQTVCANVQLADYTQKPSDVRIKIRETLSGKLEDFKIPQKIKVTTDPLVTDRFKQKRQ